MGRLGAGGGHTGETVALDNIQFPATAVPSADGNNLDDYEQGTWTLVIQDNTNSDGEGQTYSAQTGYYTKLGNRVLMDGKVICTSIGTLNTSESIKIAGFPFACGHETSVYVGQAAGLTLVAQDSLAGTMAAGANYMFLRGWTVTAGTLAVPLSTFLGPMLLDIGGQYII